MAEFTLQALHDEIENDPEGIGYKEGEAWKSDAVIAGLINDPANGDIVQRSLVSPQEIIEQITIADWETISASQRQYVGLLPSLAVVSTIQNGTEVRNNLLTIFGVGTTTRDNLIAVVQRQGSRAEVLWGEGTTVSITQVAYAANL
jgi:hypothetical protein